MYVLFIKAWAEPNCLGPDVVSATSVSTLFLFWLWTIKFFFAFLLSVFSAVARTCLLPGLHGNPKGACPPWSGANLEVLWLHPVRTVFTTRPVVTSTSDRETSNRKAATLLHFAPLPTHHPLLRRREATWPTTRWTTLRGTQSLRAMIRSLGSPWRSWEILWSWGAPRLSTRSRTRTETCKGSAAAWKPHLSKVGRCPTLQTLIHRDGQRPRSLVSFCFPKILRIPHTWVSNVALQSTYLWPVKECKTNAYDWPAVFVPVQIKSNHLYVFMGSMQSPFWYKTPISSHILHLYSSQNMKHSHKTHWICEALMEAFYKI